MTPDFSLEYFGFALFFFIFWCGIWLIHLLAIIYGKFTLHKKDVKISTDHPYSGVSILKPIVGLEPNLFVNLETFFIMNYPKYELLFCLESENDPALPTIKRLIEKYPKTNTALFTGGHSIGVNPKINNLYPGYLAAKYEFVLISDSGIRMKDDTLLDMMNHMKDDIVLVHQLPFVCDREGFSGTYEKVSFGTSYARIYLTADLLGITCHTGMSSLIRKRLLDEIGGLKTFSCYLAEDYFMASSLVNQGWKICISSQPAWQNSSICDISTFQARLTRWTKLRISMLPLTIIFEPISECLVLGLCASWSTSVLFGWDSEAFYLIHLLLWFLSDWVLLSIIQNGPLTFKKFDFVIAWLFRECSTLYIYFNAIRNLKVKWRSRVFRLSWGGIATEIQASTK